MRKWFRQKAPPIVARVGDIAIASPWARIGTHRPGMAGGYLTVTNHGSEPDRLVSAESAAAATIGIHAIKVVGREIRVRPLSNGLAIPAVTTLELTPRGYHLQLDGLQQPSPVGTVLPLTLAFEKAGRVDIELRVEDSGLVGGDILDEESQRGG